MIDITVSPLPPGWSVQATGFSAPMVYRSGALAEQAARRLAQRLADSGAPTALLIRLKDGSVGGRHLFLPACPSSGCGRRQLAA